MSSYRSLMLALALAAGSPAVAQTPPDAFTPARSGRYTMQPVDGGFLRLDTETGSVALCSKRDTSFSCDPVSDERSANRQQAEIDRLASENQALKLENKRLAEQAKPDERAECKGLGFELPSEKDVDEAMNYVERMYKKLRDRMRQLDDGKSARGTPL